VRRLPIALYLLVLLASLVDVAVINIWERGSLNPEILSPYHSIFFMIFLPIVAGVFAWLQGASVFRTVVLMNAILLSGLEDLLFCLIKYGSNISAWWTWNWHWIPLATFFGGTMTSLQLVAMCIAINALVVCYLCT